MPTVLDAAGVALPHGLDGRLDAPAAARRDRSAWRTELLYEYYWERNFPQTPTMHALRGDRYKYIHYYGIWDSDELYDLQEDPQETTNLIYNPERKDTIAEFNKRLFDEMERTDGMSIPLFRDSGGVNNKRNANKKKAADFPDEIR